MRQHKNIKHRCQEMLHKLKSEQPTGKEYLQYTWGKVSICDTHQAQRSQHPALAGVAQRAE